MERKQKLMGEVPELRDMCQELGVLDDRISAEEVELPEEKQAMKELLKERRNTKVAGWERHCCLLGAGVTQEAAAGSRSGGWSLRVWCGSSSERRGGGVSGIHWPGQGKPAA